MNLGKFGVWQPGYATTPAMANQLESLGYSALWLGGPQPDLAGIDELLAATDRLVIASSIYNIHSAGGAVAAAAYRRIAETYGDRFLLGIGVGHREQVDGYRAPMASMNAFLDELDAGGVPGDRRLLAALGPKMLAAARDRAAGAVPYLVTPEHTRRARGILGAGKLLAPEQKVVVEPDPHRARALARPRIKHPYLGLVNYTNNLRRLGFGDDDLAGDGSDRLIDELAVHGDAASVADGLQAHFAAGADHVQIHLVGADSTPHPTIPGVLLQDYGDAAFRSYEVLADELGL